MKLVLPLYYRRLSAWIGGQIIFALLLSAAQPPVPVRQFAAGQASLERHDYAAAAWAFRQVLLADPSDMEARRLLTLALYGQSYQRGLQSLESHDWDHARDSFLEALDVAPDNHEAREKLRFARCQIALREGSIQTLEQCLMFRPEDVAAKGAIATIADHQTRLNWLRSGAWRQLDRAGGLGDLSAFLNQDPPLRNLAARYTESRRRLALALRWALPLALVYAALLLCGTYFGLRTVRRESC